MGKSVKRFLSLVCALLALLSPSLSAAGPYDRAAAERNLEEHGLTLDGVLSDYAGRSGPGSAFSGFWLADRPDGSPSWYLADVTGDGCVDLCTGRMFGSGMVRVETVVYDPLSRKRYILDGYNYDYIVRGVTDGRLSVVMRGPNGYGDPITETPGTVVLEEDRLVFVPDPGWELPADCLPLKKVGP